MWNPRGVESCTPVGPPMLPPLRQEQSHSRCVVGYNVPEYKIDQILLLHIPQSLEFNSHYRSRTNKSGFSRYSTHSHRQRPVPGAHLREENGIVPEESSRSADMGVMTPLWSLRTKLNPNRETASFTVTSTGNSSPARRGKTALL